MSDLIFGMGIEATDDGNRAVRVLKPPGGGTSDIFNGSAVPTGEPPRRVKNLQPSSKLFAAGEEVVDGTPPSTPNGKSTNGHGTAAVTNGQGNNSHWRLFGPPAPVPPSPSVKPPNARLFGGDVTDGNPVTGEGYEENGKSGSSVSSRSSEAGSVGSLESGGGQVNGGGVPPVRMARGRVPPGGFSSGFW